MTMILIFSEILRFERASGQNGHFASLYYLYRGRKKYKGEGGVGRAGEGDIFQKGGGEAYKTRRALTALVS